MWALPEHPDCDSLAWDKDPAIARVGNECIRLSHYAEWLHIIEITIERTEQGLIPDHPSDYQRQWYDRVNSYGAETIALADAIRDSALYQRAVASGHLPSDEEVSARLGQERLRWESSCDFIELVRLAQNQDLAGFIKLAEETRNPDIINSLQDLTPYELMEALEGLDWRQLEEMLNEGEAYVESMATNATGRKYFRLNCAAKWQYPGWRRRYWTPASAAMASMRKCPAWVGWPISRRH